MALETVAENACFGGTQGVYKHTSQELDCTRRARWCFGCRD